MRDDRKLWAAIERIARHGPDLDSRWRHVKSGEVYRVVACGVREADLTPCVMYCPLDPAEMVIDGTPLHVAPHLVRPLDEFLDGRFVRVGATRAADRDDDAGD